MGCCSSGGIRRYYLYMVGEMAAERCGSQVIAGRYHRMPASIGECYTLSREERVAVKTLGLHQFVSEAALNKEAKHLSREIEILMTVDHPHVVRLHDVFETPTKLHVVMELLQGGSLQQRAERLGHLDEGDAAVATQHMMLAVSYLHELFLMHRDLKPENFVHVGPAPGEGALKLIDFGLSKHWRPDKVMTRASGTLPFQAPEVLDHAYDHRCDWWSLGVIVFFLLLGHLPFVPEAPLYAGDDADGRLRGRIRRGAYQIRWRARWDALSAEARDFVGGLLRVRPGERLGEGGLRHAWLAGAPPPFVATRGRAPSCCVTGPVEGVRPP